MPLLYYNVYLAGDTVTQHAALACVWFLVSVWSLVTHFWLVLGCIYCTHSFFVFPHAAVITVTCFCAWSISQQYTEELLCQQQFLEVYLEGTRSRSGKPSTARAGMLSIVVDALHFGSVADVLVVPVGISYDRIIEGNYNSEQLVSIHAFFKNRFCLRLNKLP